MSALSKPHRLLALASESTLFKCLTLYLPPPPSPGPPSVRPRIRSTWRLHAAHEGRRLLAVRLDSGVDVLPPRPRFAAALPVLPVGPRWLRPADTRQAPAEPVRPGLAVRFPDRRGADLQQSNALRGPPVPSSGRLSRVVPPRLRAPVVWGPRRPWGDPSCRDAGARDCAAVSDGGRVSCRSNSGEPVIRF